MKPYIRAPSKAQISKQEAAEKGAGKKKPAAAVEKEEEEQEADILDDRDLDYSKQDNVDLVLNKYKN